jgi:phospholipase C
MLMRPFVLRSSRCLRVGLTLLVAFNYTLVGPLLSAVQATSPDDVTLTPIKHTIIIIGENRTFDHIFATYVPKVSGQTVDNLLSRKIIKADGTPGPNYSLGVQFSACDPGTGVNCQQAPTGFYENSPQGRSLYSVLPAPLAGGPTNVCKDNGICTLSDATSSENGLAQAYYQYMLTGGTGLKSHTPDTRIPNVATLPPGPFQLSSPTFPYDSYAASPVHRFYQMWQQLDCNMDYALLTIPAGCNADLFAWVEVTVGAGTYGL